MTRDMIMKQLFFSLTVALVALLPVGGFSMPPASLEQVCADCEVAGNKPAGKPIQSELKKETSLVGMAYLNDIYRNDRLNAHFCQAMLLMNAQIPPGTENPYLQLFDDGMGKETLGVLDDIQLAFDYAIARSNPSPKKMQAALERIQALLNTD